MDVSKWPLNKIMQLPDHCFGQRWPVTVMRHIGVLGPTWAISYEAFPDVGVTWSVAYRWWSQNEAVRFCNLAFGDQLPTSEAMMNGLEPALPGFGEHEGPVRDIVMPIGTGEIVWPMRRVQRFQGRRLVIEITGVGFINVFAEFVFEVSSLPKEVPDCLLSV